MAGLFAGLSAGFTAGLDAVLPEGLEAVLPDGLFCCPEGRATVLEGLFDWPEGRDTEDFCDELEDELDEVRDPPRWACANASDWKPNNAEPTSIEAKNILIDLIVEFV